MSESRITIFEVILKDENLFNKTNKEGCEDLKQRRVRLKFYYVFK